MQQFLIGVDGGASKCRIQVQDMQCRVLGEAVAGPANIRLSVAQSWTSIQQGIQQVFSTLHCPYVPLQCHLGIGIAGCEVQSAYQAFIDQADDFASLKVTSDAHVACLGAHHGQDGAVIIIGTGMVGFQQQKGQHVFVAGGGFPHDDQGSGAWIGLAAISHALKALDGRIKASGLSKVIFAHFSKSKPAMLAWADQANATLYASLAPLVIDLAKQADPAAIKILQEAANEVYQVAVSLIEQQSTPLNFVLHGGIAESLHAYLPKDLQDRLVRAQASPEAGAIYLIGNRT